METELITLFVITAGAIVCPVLSALIPRKLVPETVFLLIFGMVAGPSVLGWLDVGGPVELLSDLGLGFLFLLAGYEIEPRKLIAKQGRHGLLTWCITFAIALLIVMLGPGFKDNSIGWLAVGIALTTTALGTLMPILSERKLTGTQVGDAIIAYGTWGELMPIFAISLLLSSRATWLTAVILGAFFAVAIALAIIQAHAWKKNSRMARFISGNAQTNSQTTVRAAVCTLVGLLALSSIFHLDIVLGAFAAGFIIKFIIPKGDEDLELKLSGIGYGFFIPLFFIVSGSKIDPQGIVEQPLLLFLFIAMLLLIRAVPVFVSLSICKESRSMDLRNKATVAIYCTTALPLIVAVTSIAVSSGAMTQDIASLLIAAGGITVFIMPLGASITFHTIDADLPEAFRKIRVTPSRTIHILKTHRRLERKRNTARKKERADSCPVPGYDEAEKPEDSESKGQPRG